MELKKIFENESIYESSRKFIVLSYNVGHGELLLCSPKTDVNTRIEILFKDVIAMECRMTLNGLVLMEESMGFIENRESKPILIMEPGHKIYSIQCKDWSGFIVAGTVFLKED